MKIFSTNTLTNIVRSFQTSCNRSGKLPRSFMANIMSEDPEGPYSTEDCVRINGLTVWPWSISGVESTVVVQGENFNLAFDMGYATNKSVSCKHVFISHGHMDHIAGVTHHASKRALSSMKPATYYCPSHLRQNLQNIASLHSEMHGDQTVIGDLNVQGVEPGETVRLPGSVYVRAFRTVHRVASQGYIVYTQKRSLKPEYVGRDSKEIRELIRQGVEVNVYQEVPVVAYTGDTMIEVFKDPPTSDLLKVKLLITEATYIDDQVKNGTTAVERARNYGHIHLQEIIDMAEAFDNVDNILLVHFSNKYSVGFIRDKVEKLLKDRPELYTKIHLGTQMKQQIS